MVDTEAEARRWRPASFRVDRVDSLYLFEMRMGFFYLEKKKERIP